MSKLYTGKAYFRSTTFGLLNPILTTPLAMNVRNVVGGGDQAWVVAEMTADSVCKNGMAYNQVYAWVCRSVFSLASVMCPLAFLDQKMSLQYQ